MFKIHVRFEFWDDSTLVNQKTGKTIEKPLKELPWNQQKCQQHKHSQLLYCSDLVGCLAHNRYIWQSRLYVSPDPSDSAALELLLWACPYVCLLWSCWLFDLKTAILGQNCQLKLLTVLNMAFCLPAWLYWVYDLGIATLDIVVPLASLTCTCLAWEWLSWSLSSVYLPWPDRLLGLRIPIIGNVVSFPSCRNCCLKSGNFLACLCSSYRIRYKLSHSKWQIISPDQRNMLLFRYGRLHLFIQSWSLETEIVWFHN